MGHGVAMSPEFGTTPVPMEPVTVTLWSYPYPCYTLVQNLNSFFENDAECVKTFGKNSKKWVRNIHVKNSEVL